MKEALFTSQLSDLSISICLSCPGYGHTFGNSKGGAPLVTKDVQADAAVGVDVGVVDASGEVDLGWLEGVVGREVDG